MEHIINANKEYSELIKKRYATVPIEIWNQKLIHSSSIMVFGRFYKKVEWYLLVSILFTETPTQRNVSVFYGKAINKKSTILKRMYDLGCLDIVQNENKKVLIILTKLGLEIINEIISMFKKHKDIQKFLVQPNRKKICLL